MFNLAGFAQVSFYGDLSGSPYGASAERLVAVGRLLSNAAWPAPAAGGRGGPGVAWLVN
jgi:hypothetical protein